MLGPSGRASSRLSSIPGGFLQQVAGTYVGKRLAPSARHPPPAHPPPARCHRGMPRSPCSLFCNPYLGDLSLRELRYMMCSTFDAFFASTVSPDAARSRQNAVAATSGFVFGSI
jgi:hypothetical protein